MVDKKVRLVVTDDAGGYRKLEEKGFRHEAVAHSQNEYVRGEATPDILSPFGPAEARHHGFVPPRQRKVSAAVPERVLVPV